MQGGVEIDSGTFLGVVHRSKNCVKALKRQQAVGVEVEFRQPRAIREDQCSMRVNSSVKPG